MTGGVRRRGDGRNFDANVFEHLLVLVLGDDARLRSDIAAALAG
jgi:hypothetical protein